MNYDDDPAIEELREEIRRINAALSGDLTDADKARLRLERLGLSEDLAALRRAA